MVSEVCRSGSCKGHLCSVCILSTCGLMNSWWIDGKIWWYDGSKPITTISWEWRSISRLWLWVPFGYQGQLIQLVFTIQTEVLHFAARAGVSRTLVWAPRLGVPGWISDICFFFERDVNPPKPELAHSLRHTRIQDSLLNDVGTHACKGNHWPLMLTVIVQILHGFSYFPTGLLTVTSEAIWVKLKQQCFSLFLVAGQECE